MYLHEHQAKDLLEPFGIPLARRKVAFSQDELEAAVQSLQPPLVVKAQVHAGGRGKAGGIKIVRSAEEAVAAAQSMLGSRLVSAQTGGTARIIRRILFSEALDIDRELYVGIALDRSLRQLVMMASTEGGVEIEKTAADRPQSVCIEAIDPCVGLRSFQCGNMAHFLGLPARPASAVLSGLYQAFVRYDCTLLEINPLVLTPDGGLYALDAKMIIDDNALFRHPEIERMRDTAEEDPLEVEAGRYHLNYIKLNGSIGCMVNGAGLAMATMDLIQMAGAEPANFLDVGGAASAQTIEKGLMILVSDPDVKTVFINIFGGIVRCDRVAAGIVDAARKFKFNTPMVVRLAGTRAEEASQLLHASGLNLLIASSLADAGQKLMQCGRGRDAD